jgi:hypothetical protein
MSKVVGIDLGTTNSLVAYVKDGVPIVIRDQDGDALVPSVVSVSQDNTIHVGREAQRRLLTDAARTAYSVKRFMGKGARTCATRPSIFRSASAATAEKSCGSGLADREFTPPEISAFILRELKHRAEAHFAEQGEVDNEVDRGWLHYSAGLLQRTLSGPRPAMPPASPASRCCRIINEPPPPSLAYGLDKKHSGVDRRVRPRRRHLRHLDPAGSRDGVFQVLSTNGDTPPRR